MNRETNGVGIVGEWDPYWKHRFILDGAVPERCKGCNGRALNKVKEVAQLVEIGAVSIVGASNKINDDLEENCRSGRVFTEPGPYGTSSECGYTEQEN